jgi:hypothetical protein
VTHGPCDDGLLRPFLGPKTVESSSINANVGAVFPSFLKALGPAG